MINKKFIFIIGLHRSGTSFLHDIFRKQTNISGLKFGSNFYYDEGQYYQKILKTDEDLGWVGKIAFHPDAHQTEHSEILKKYTSEDVYNMWKPHLQDETLNTMVEKSPPYITQTRLLQAFFPNSYFVVIIRHPIINSISTKDFVKNRYDANIHDLVKHWFKAHEILFEDLKYIKNKFILTYEELFKNNLTIINELEKFVNIKFDYKDFFSFNSNLKHHINAQKYSIYEYECNKYGYSVKNLETYFSYDKLNNLIK